MQDANEAGKITVVVPTYRRSGPLAWALASIVRQRFDGVPTGRRRLVVLNNDRDREPVIRTVNAVLERWGDGGWEVQLHHREPPLTAIDNMYNGIVEFAEDGDSVFLHGDDDIMLPRSLALRAQMFAHTPEMEILLAGSSSGMVFTPGDSEMNTRVHFMGRRPEPAAEEPVQVAGLADLYRLGYILISCQGYRNTARLRKMFGETRALLEKLPASLGERLGMFPQFLPILGAQCGVVYETRTQACLRGEFARDVIGRRPDSAYWSASALYLLTKTELGREKALEPMREEFTREALQRSFFSLGRKNFQELARLTQLRRRAATKAGIRAVVLGMGDYVRHRLHLNALRMRRQLRRSAGEGWEEVFKRY